MTNKVYDFLKYVALIGMPAAITFYGVIGAVLNLPYTQEVITIAVAGEVFLGSLLGLSSMKYNNK